MSLQHDILRQKWGANIDKVSFARLFPCLLQEWEQAVGKRIVSVMHPQGAPDVQVVVFDDNTVLLAATGKARPQPAEILACLRFMRGQLQPFYPEAYRELDKLEQADLELKRQARLQNILGAVRNNIGGIPELYQELPALLAGLQAGVAAPGCDLPSDDGMATP